MLANFGFDTAENEPSKVWPIERSSPRGIWAIEDREGEESRFFQAAKYGPWYTTFVIQDLGDENMYEYSYGDLFLGCIEAYFS